MGLPSRPPRLAPRRRQTRKTLAPKQRPRVPPSAAKAPPLKPSLPAEAPPARPVMAAGQGRVTAPLFPAQLPYELPPAEQPQKVRTESPVLVLIAPRRAEVVLPFRASVLPLNKPP